MIRICLKGVEKVNINSQEEQEVREDDKRIHHKVRYVMSDFS